MNNINYNKLMERLNAGTKEERLKALSEVKELLDCGEAEVSPREILTNNHIHTKYSFSPYSPAKAAWMGYKSGLATVGIMDHDSVSGAREFIEAGKILELPTTIGFEIRTDWSKTTLFDKRINNPDQTGTAYISAHGIPHQNIDKVDEFLKPIRRERENRSRLETDNINALLARFDIRLDFDKDIIPISYAEDGGSITERHILYALSEKLTRAYGRGKEFAAFIENEFDIPLSPKQMDYLSDTSSDHYVYDILNILKSAFVEQIYVDASSELPDVREAVAFIKSIGAIPSYCYLGDVGQSPTGDKAAQKFEDDYLEDVLDTCAGLGFDAIAFMPSRNTPEQLERLMRLCSARGFLQVSGEDINQPRQSFLCEQLRMPEFRHLIDTTWAMIGHELAATCNSNNAMFVYGRPQSPVELGRLIDKYKVIGMKSKGAEL